MIKIPQSQKFPEGFVKRIGKGSHPFVTYIIGPIYSEGMMHKTFAEAKKAANKRVMIDRLQGKKPLLRSTGARLAIYYPERSFKRMAEAESYAIGTGFVMKYK